MANRNRTPEAKAKDNVLLRANQWNARLFKNNSGVAYTEGGRPVFFGLGNECKKTAEDIRTPDDVGWTEVTITPEMVGKKVAVFTCIDSKKLGFIVKNNYTKGTREYGQQKFFDIVKNANGIAGFASCPEQVDDIFNEFNAKVTK